MKWGTCEDREGSKLESAVIKAAEFSCWAWATHGDTLAMRYLLYIPTLSSGHSNSGYSVSLCICLAWQCHAVVVDIIVAARRMVKTTKSGKSYVRSGKTM